jgi:acyl-[acyl-carrier-protein] desaturase
MQPAANGSSNGKILIVNGPWTSEARQRALERAVLEHCADYFRRTRDTRSWSPWHDLPLEEMRQLGHRLSRETTDLVEGFLGVEEHVGDYVGEGLEMFRDDRARRNLQLSWGSDEAKHGVAWELVLQHSGSRTEAQLKAYLDKVREHRWSVKAHSEADTPLGVTVYAMLQERATYFHYQQMRARIREEYGLPAMPTAKELDRGYEIGACEAFRVVGRDELAHHVIFLKIVQSYVKYFPSTTFDVLTRVLAGFEMPAVRFLPNLRSFLRAVNRTRMYGKSIHALKVQQPVLRALGLEDSAAFERAGRQAAALPEGVDPTRIRLTRSGDWAVGAVQEGLAAATA